MKITTVLAWLAAPATVALLHRYFLSFASSMVDLPPDAAYWRRTAFNFIQAVAGNEHRVVTARIPAPTPPVVTDPNEPKGIAK